MTDMYGCTSVATPLQRSFLQPHPARGGHKGPPLNDAETGGTGFCHESYIIRGRMEAIYADIHTPVGFTAFAPLIPARGGMFSARNRVGREGEASIAAPYDERQIYGADDASTQQRSGD